MFHMGSPEELADRLRLDLGELLQLVRITARSASGRRAIARANCLPRKISSVSLSRWMIVEIVGPTAAIRIVRIAIATTTPTKVKPLEAVGAVSREP
jgi:hypothetical protein